MNSIQKNSLFIAIVIFTAVFSCSRQIPNPISPAKIDIIPSTPTNLVITVSDRMVFLSWSVPDTQGIRSYRIYKSDSVSTNFLLLAEVQQSSYSVADLRNGQTYYFKISAVNYSRFEGYSSTIVSAVPNLYGIIINNGDEFTNNRDIVLTIVAPLGTQYMLISNDSTFLSAEWEIIVATKSWRLPSGDTLKTVYARYRNSNDQVTANFFFDKIMLDTQALIDSVTFSPASLPLRAGDRIHLKLYAGEPGGQARVTVGQNLLTLDLFDDGTRGDSYAGDGIYETNYSVANNLDFENAEVFGNFTDRAGNIARQTQAPHVMSVRRAPDPVSILNINNPTGFFDRLTISWSVSGAADFAHYQILRSISAGVDSADYLVRTISSAQTTALTDTGLTQNTRYYYKVFVVDNTGLSSASNEVSGITNLNTPPDSVILFPIIAVPGTHDRLSLTWSVSVNQDFLRYELYRSYDNTVTTSDILLLASSTATAFIDSNLAADSTYYYAVLTLDRAGNSTWSATRSGRTGIDEPPGAATLYPVNPEPDFYRDITLQWIHPVVADFQSYRIYSWHSDNGRSDSSLVGLILQQDSTILVNHPVLNQGVDTANVWYIVQTYDQGGNVTPSNAIRVHLIDNVPASVIGAVIQDSAFMAVTWSRSEIPDFGSYRLLRDTLSSPNQAITIYMTTNQDILNLNDRGLVTGKTYYYWLDIFDRRNHSSRSFLGSSRW
jgi:fibronectin type 3 domain-containing protein